eukprot:1138838-Pelagomonas_calceolata.AAC.10
MGNEALAGTFEPQRDSNVESYKRWNAKSSADEHPLGNKKRNRDAEQSKPAPAPKKCTQARQHSGVCVCVCAHVRAQALLNPVHVRKQSIACSMLPSTARC